MVILEMLVPEIPEVVAHWAAAHQIPGQVNAVAMVIKATLADKVDAEVVEH